MPKIAIGYLIAVLIESIFVVGVCIGVLAQSENDDISILYATLSLVSTAAFALLTTSGLRCT